jgi:hypothetical protein
MKKIPFRDTAPEGDSQITPAEAAFLAALGSGVELAEQVARRVGRVAPDQWGRGTNMITLQAVLVLTSAWVVDAERGLSDHPDVDTLAERLVRFFVASIEAQRKVRKPPPPSLGDILGL